MVGGQNQQRRRRGNTAAEVPGASQIAAAKAALVLSGGTADGDRCTLRLVIHAVKNFESLMRFWAEAESGANDNIRNKALYLHCYLEEFKFDD